MPYRFGAGVGSVFVEQVQPARGRGARRRVQRDLGADHERGHRRRQLRRDGSERERLHRLCGGNHDAVRAGARNKFEQDDKALEVRWTNYH